MSFAKEQRSCQEKVALVTSEMLGKGQSDGSASETSRQVLQSTLPVDSAERKGPKVGGQLSSSLQVGIRQQNQQLLLTPASLQLAQLQAQLTLHRLKLAQGSSTATAATVLNQVLSNVAMAQPLFNQLRNPQGGFTTGMLCFPTTTSALGAGGFKQNPGNMTANHHGGGNTVGQQGADFGKKSGPTYPSDIDRRLQYNLGTSAVSATAADGHYSIVSTQAKQLNNVEFKRDFYRQDVSSQKAGFNIGDQNMNLYNCTGRTEQWNGPTNVSHNVNAPLASDLATVWTAPEQAVRPRNELYNPEEPTSDQKFKHKSGGSSFVADSIQGFGSYRHLLGNEETLCSGSRTLQPYQVNDYNAVTPTLLPHQCSICDKKVYNLKDWEQHVKGKLHLQNIMSYNNQGSALISVGGPHYTLRRPSDALNGGDSVSFNAAGQDVSSGVNASYVPAAAMKNYSLPNAGFTSLQPESKPFPPRKATTGRVVHICNLPEGSCTENDVINLGLPFGKVTNYILMRSTHQAFLEMAYIEAAQAMVQYYQLTPAMINNQKLLIRMSKRYQELQLKKPGKDVQAIIQDIASHWERDVMQELEHSIPDRARSRSPLRSSLSPHSHSPSFTSCSSAHSPQAPPCRAQERGSNGLGPRQGSWDWSSHYRRGEEDKERDDLSRRNGYSTDGDRLNERPSDRPNDRLSDRRKAYGKPSDYAISRSADERGDKGITGNRDFPRGSPQSKSFNSYRSMEEGFYMKSDKVSRSPYQRHDSKSKRKNGSDYSRHSRYLESEKTDESLRRTPEDKNLHSPSRGRNRKPSKRCTSLEKHDSGTTNTEGQSKDHVSPQRGDKPKDAAECLKHKDTEKELESGENTDDECCYPKNMEEFLTVDEVGEDDSIIEPDLPELEEDATCPEESVEEQTQTVVETVLSPAPTLEEQETSIHKPVQNQTCERAEVPVETSGTEKTVLIQTSVEEPLKSPVTSKTPITYPSDFSKEESKAAPEETSTEDKVTDTRPLEEKPVRDHIQMSRDSKVQDLVQVTEASSNVTQHKDSILKKDIETPSSSIEQEKVVIEHIIPLGVEFIEPRTGFYCKLCELFYTSEETAKLSHCRSTVHYRNLQVCATTIYPTLLHCYLCEHVHTVQYLHKHHVCAHSPLHQHHYC
ncbi:RNA-binding protein 20 isoform X2 [Syngnathoides biaculeatus]|uniref:RNA-binding protein 20 isoform X2 n=1 Tax=Syngnathoides biaculeatus TaxID=300417 RepID=UPI002ADE3B29|nr:RNA-binding protein 20 isoform X2 [Syngnathoides biaculeatus]